MLYCSFGRSLPTTKERVVPDRQQHQRHFDAHLDTPSVHHHLTPRTLHQVYQQIVAAAQGSVKDGRQLVAVRGQLGALKDKGPSTLYYYDVPLSGDGETIALDIPKALLRK